MFASTQLSFAFAAEDGWSEIDALSIDDLDDGEMKAVRLQAILFKDCQNKIISITFVRHITRRKRAGFNWAGQDKDSDCTS